MAAAEMARGIRALMKFGARLNAPREGGREREGAAAPIVRVDIVVGGSGFGHQALLGTERGSEGGLGAGEWSQRESMTNFI